MRTVPGYGLPTPASQPVPNRKWGRTQSPIHEASSAAAVQAIARAQIGEPALDLTPTHGWHFDEAGAGTVQANDYVGSAHLVSQGVLATRVQAEGPDDRAAVQILNQATGAWRCTDVNHVNMTTNAFAFAARIRFPVLGSGGWYLSKSSNAGNGYFGAGANNAPGLTMSVRATDATAAAASAASVPTYADNTWRWILVGRDTVGAIVWSASLLGTAETAFAAAKDLGNTTAGAYFGLWFNLFAGSAGGVTCDISDLLCWENAAARNVYLNRVEMSSALDLPA
jgi:hypothetical protein